MGYLFCGGLLSFWKYKDRERGAKETLYGEGWEKMDKMGERMVGGKLTQTRENIVHL